ncbi:hypothetical protein GCM10009793_16910 [Brachybacterium phenoliresistens]
MDIANAVPPPPAARTQTVAAEMIQGAFFAIVHLFVSGAVAPHSHCGPLRPRVVSKCRPPGRRGSEDPGRGRAGARALRTHRAEEGTRSIEPLSIVPGRARGRKGGDQALRFPLAILYQSVTVLVAQVTR